MQTTLQEKLRRQQNTLYISGTVVITFAVWSILRNVLYVLLMGVPLLDAIGATGLEDTQDFSLKIYIAVYVGSILFELLLHCYIGFSARKEGRGARKGYGYIVVAMLFVLVVVAGTAMMVYLMMTMPAEVTESSGNTDTLAVSELINLTMLYAVLQVIVSSIRVKRLRRKLAKASDE